MCKPASFVIADGGKKVFWSKFSDSHEDIIREYGLVESVASKITIVRCEVSPVSNDLMTPFHSWIFKTDQTLLPEWYNPAEAETLCRTELPAWFESKVIVSGRREHKSGILYIYGGSVEVYSGSAVVYGGSAVVRGGSAVVRGKMSATIINYTQNIISLEENAVCIDRSNGKPVIHVAGE